MPLAPLCSISSPSMNSKENHQSSSRIAQIGFKSILFCCVWPWHLADDLEQEASLNAAKTLGPSDRWQPKINRWHDQSPPIMEIIGADSLLHPPPPPSEKKFSKKILLKKYLLKNFFFFFFYWKKFLEKYFFSWSWYILESDISPIICALSITAIIQIYVRCTAKFHWPDAVQENVKQFGYLLANHHSSWSET